MMKIIRFNLLTALFLIPLLILATHPEAQEFLKFAKNVLIHDGYSITDSQTGLLNKDESVNFATTFYKGNTYAILLGGDMSAKDISVFVFDEDGMQLHNDFGLKRGEPLIFTCDFTGTYFIKIKLYETDGKPSAYFAYTVGYKK